MKDQFVIMCVESAQDVSVLLPWGRHFAERLNHKGLMLLHVSKERGDERWLEESGVPYASLVGEWHTAIEGLATAFNGILALVAVDASVRRGSLSYPARLLREFRDCKVAYLCVPKGVSLLPRGGEVALTFTYRREGKEKLLWASYLTRFVGCRVTIAHRDYRDGGFRSQLANNLRFADKLFKPLDVNYATVVLRKGGNVDMAAVEQLEPDVLIARTTDARDRDLLDWLMPLPERRLLGRSTPVLFLNPREDLYILCD